jgi:hypothetical protein
MFQINETGLYVLELNEELKENYISHIFDTVKSVLTCIQMPGVVVRFEISTVAKLSILVL